MYWDEGDTIHPTGCCTLLPPFYSILTVVIISSRLSNHNTQTYACVPPLLYDGTVDIVDLSEQLQRQADLLHATVLEVPADVPARLHPSRISFQDLPDTQGFAEAPLGLWLSAHCTATWTLLLSMAGAQLPQRQQQGSEQLVSASRDAVDAHELSVFEAAAQDQALPSTTADSDGESNPLFMHGRMESMWSVAVAMVGNAAHGQAVTRLLEHLRACILAYWLLQDVGMADSLAVLLDALKQLGSIGPVPLRTTNDPALAAWKRGVRDVGELKRAAEELQADVDAGQGRMAHSMRCSGLLHLLNTSHKGEAWVVVVNAATQPWCVGGWMSGRGRRGHPWGVLSDSRFYCIDFCLNRLLHELQAHPQHGVLWRVCTMPSAVGKSAGPIEDCVCVWLITPEQLQSGQLTHLPQCKAMRYGRKCIDALTQLPTV